MNISRKIQHLILWVMLAVVGVAYTGKALHTHSESYYSSLRATKAAAANGMSDDCPICHFNLLLFITDSSQAILVCTILLAVFVTIQPIVRTNEEICFFSLRAPPVVL
jgi:hypothetical protein